MAVIKHKTTSHIFSRKIFNKKQLRFLITLALIFMQIVAVADSQLSLNTYYYKVEPGLNIIKPSIEYKNEYSLDTTINARLTVDRVQTEPVDAVSSASQTMGATIAKTDIRQEYNANLTHQIDQWRVGGGFLTSLENDYTSYSPSVFIARDFNLRNTTFLLGYAHNFDEVNGEYMPSPKKKDVDNFAVSLTQVLSTTTLMQIGLSSQFNKGYLGTGNRKLVLLNGNEYDEYLPSERRRDALGVRFAQWFPTETAVHLSFRYYQDTWEITSNTIEVAVHQKVTEKLKLKVESRFYDQSAAHFIKDEYTGSEKYLTTSNSLKSFSSVLHGIHFTYDFGAKAESSSSYNISMGYVRYKQNPGLISNMLHANLEYVY